MEMVNAEPLNSTIGALALQVLCALGQKNNSNNHIKELWFEQKLNHFDPQDTRKWQQRYFLNDEFYKSGGPIFLYVGGEKGIDMLEVRDSSWVDYAKQFGALCFTLEHRFYGKSRPVEDLSLPNIKYMNSHQALADLATFIVAIREKYNLPSDAKLIAFGGSYPGALATWLRIKYPHLVFAVVASSAAINLKLDGGDYIDLGLKQIGLQSKNCLSKVNEGFSELDKNLKTVDGRRLVEEKFNLCTPLEKSINNSKDVGTLYLIIIRAIAGVAQSDSAYAYGTTIKSMCDEVNAIDNALDSLAAGVRHVMKNESMRCLDYVFENRLASLRNTSWSAKPKDANVFERRYQYLLCNEVAIFITLSALSQNIATKFPIEYSALECQGAFGEQYDVAFLKDVVKSTKLLYGGPDMVVSNVLFVRGTKDPWFNTQYSEKFKTKMPLITIEGTTHIEDMLPKSENDPPQLIKARSDIASVINDWINS